ncbi:type I restriction/modification system, specificity subunit [Aliarcobacter cibarius]|uniref:Type I restriction/modification system, specificity subunit n=1 Tax=Aliarcobacter cibarius TaxID=255507 RepID=A0A7L5JN36_9BACT|nr:restriction endonuclease subunit S [Aliarcobacter cibarius]QKJ26539.1 type I restriction/modification system, specificity subunit [Aliarcobacter cibarius]
MKSDKLSNLVDKIFSGGTPSTSNEKYWNGQYSWLSSGETGNKFINSTEKSITKLGIDNSSTKLALKNDIVIASAGQGKTRGQTSFCNIDTYINQSVVAIRTNEKILDSKWLFYNLSSRYEEMRSLSDSHSIRGSLTTKLLGIMEIEYPELETQKKIAHILSTLDEKIELNRKMNQTLEEMAQTIFKSWFVDFDPVHAKANCESEAELENIAKELGISKEILDLFPSEFIESEMGMIPKGWEATELSQICKIQSGYAFKSAWWQDTGVKVIKIKNIDGNRVNTLDCECVSEEIATKNSNFKLSSGDFLIAMTGATVGKVGVIYTSDEEYLLNQRVGRFQPIKYYDEYVKIFASSSKFFESIQGQAQGSAQPNISAREIETVKIIKPNNEIMKVFSSLLNPFFSKILEHQGEIQTLEKTRDTLLPKLLSGEIDVSELKI